MNNEWSVLSFLSVQKKILQEQQEEKIKVTENVFYGFNLTSRVRNNFNYKIKFSNE